MLLYMFYFKKTTRTCTSQQHPETTMLKRISVKQNLFNFNYALQNACEHYETKKPHTNYTCARGLIPLTMP